MGATIEIDTDQHSVSARIGDVGFCDRVLTTLRTIDLTKREGVWSRFNTMKCILDFLFNLAADGDLKLKSLHVRHIECRKEHFRHHTIRERKPHFRGE